MSGRLALLYNLLKSHSDLQVSGGVCPKWVLKNLCAVVWGSGKDVRWSLKVGVTLKVADWHIPLAQPSVPQGFPEGVLSQGCHVQSVKCVQTRFSLTYWKECGKFVWKKTVWGWRDNGVVS
jgi:hypothetical protein